MSKLGDNPSFEDSIKVMSNYTFFFVLSIIIGIASFLLSIFCYTCIIYSSLNKKKFIKFSESVRGGKEHFLRYLGYSIVAGIFIIGLLILLVIPGIIFGIFWCFSAFIFIRERKGILASLKESHKLVKGKWWKTFGFILLFFIIIVVISILISFLTELVNIIINPQIIKSLLDKSFYSSPIWYVNDFISLIGGFISNLISLPLGFLFIKNFYLDRKK